MRARTARLLFIHRRRTEPAAVASQGMHGTHARTWLTWRETGTGALTSRPSAISWGLIYDQYQREGREGGSEGAQGGSRGRGFNCRSRKTARECKDELYPPYTHYGSWIPRLITLRFNIAVCTHRVTPLVIAPFDSHVEFFG